MTTFTWIALAVLIGVTIMVNRTSSRMKRELRAAAGRTGSHQHQTDAAFAAPSGDVLVPGGSEHTKSSPIPDDLAIPGAQKNDDPPARNILGVPELVHGVYSVADLPELGWDYTIRAIGVDVFDSADRILTAAREMPLIEMPLFAFFNAISQCPGTLRVLGESFSAGSAEHRPFSFLGQESDDHTALTMDDLSGRAIVVLGRYMSPTVVLANMLKELGMECRLWDVENWRLRSPASGRVDLLVGDSLDSQLFALRSGLADYVMAIYPHTHAPVITRTNNGSARAVTIEQLERRMGEMLSGRLLNVLVTFSRWYQENAAWRTSADELAAAVAQKNQLLRRRALDPAPTADGEALASGELDFMPFEEVPGEQRLLELAAIGERVGLSSETVQKGLVKAA